MGEHADDARAWEIANWDGNPDTDPFYPGRRKHHIQLTPQGNEMTTLLCRNVAIKGQHFLPPDEKATVGAIQADNDTPLDIALVLEPENPHDPFAVRAEVGGRKVGYLAAEVSPLVVWMIGEGVTPVFIATEKNKLGNFIGKVVIP